MTTLKDISRETGLSVTQVSRALNDHNDVNEETRERVKAAARALNYQANITARKLVSGRSGIVGLVVGSDKATGSDGIFMEMVAGLSSQFSSRDMQFVLHVMQEREPVLPTYQQLIGKGIMDGFVLIDPLKDDERIDFLRQRETPFVLHGRTVEEPDYPYFDIPNTRIFRELTDHLLQRGHRDIALINGIEGRTYVTSRTTGYQQALAAAGVSFDPSFLVHGDMNEAHGLISAVHLFSTGKQAPTAIICGNVRIAKGVYQALDSLGLSIPNDVSVVAHDDLLLNMRASAFFPALTVSKAPLRDSWEPLALSLAGAIEGRVLADLQIMGCYEFISRHSVSVL